jgi:hypothetical protein
VCDCLAPEPELPESDALLREVGRVLLDVHVYVRALFLIAAASAIALAALVALQGERG